ncbi:MAG: ATP-binding protein [Pseudorhodobacter sp.]|nr:ATP-binding protein [Pseudorhodobacter sp.]
MLLPIIIPHPLLPNILPHEIHSSLEFYQSKWWPLFDAILLVLLITPLIYYLAVRPFSLAWNRAVENLRQFKTILDLSPDQIYITDPDTLQFLYMNKAGQIALGWTEGQYLKNSLHDMGERFDEALFRKVAESLVQGFGQSNTYETTGVHQEPVEVTMQLLHFMDENRWLVLIVRDITERKNLEKAKDKFVSTVSHELRTPLTSIKGSLGLIKNGVVNDNPDKFARLLDIAVVNCERLGLLIDDILDMEKLTAGMVKFQIDTVDLSCLVNEAIAANESYATRLGVCYKAIGVDIPVLVNADSNRLMQVMANLMSNAAKFSNEGGQIEVSLSLNGSRARISIMDHGAGIPETARKTIFERFTQVDSSDERKKGGTGLGLNIAKEIVERHGGTIGLTSEIGKGTTFFFELPIKLAEKKTPDGGETFHKQTKRSDSASAA